MAFAPKHAFRNFDLSIANGKLLSLSSYLGTYAQADLMSAQRAIERADDRIKNLETRIGALTKDDYPEMSSFWVWRPNDSSTRCVVKVTGFDRQAGTVTATAIDAPYRSYTNEIEVWKEAVVPYSEWKGAF